MTTSGTTTWSMTAGEFITHALTENGILNHSEAPTSSELGKCITILNGILRSWMPGEWLGATAEVTVPANDPSGSLSVQVSEVLSARFVQSDTYERELERWERSDYLSLPNKAQSGDPCAYVTENQRDAVVLYLWPVPTVDTTLKIEYLRFPEVVTNQAETVDFPQKYNEALFTALAVRCAGIFGKQAPPELIARAQVLRQQFEDAERPESYIIEMGLD